jgi:hypothetical protein
VIDRFKLWIGIPAAVIASLAAVYGAFTFIKEIADTPERLEAHEATSRVVHDSAKRFDDELHAHAEAQEKLLEGLVRGECIENPKADLARQGLLRKCGDLGIVR